MKLYSVALVCLLSVSGCISSEVKTQSSLNAARCDRFVDLMDKGLTTRSNEQDFIKANRKAWWVVNNAANGAPLPADVAEVSTGGN